MKHILHLFLSFAFILTSALSTAQITKLSNNTNLTYGFTLGSVGILFADDDDFAPDSLWKTDGTPGGTMKYVDFVAVDAAEGFAFYMNKLFFTGVNAANGNELWVTDGTTAGTSLVKDIEMGTGSSDPTDYFVFNGTLYFFANTSANGIELWKTNGTEAGTVLVEDINLGPASSYDNFANFFTNGDSTILYFLANNGTNGTELWRTDGTEPGTMMVKDINSGPPSSKPLFSLFSYIGFGSDIIFAADDGTGAELWKSNGTELGTTLVKDINPFPSPLGSSPTSFLPFNGKLYFSADDGTNGTELWETNGTPGGTNIVKDINPGIDASNPLLFTAVFINNKFYFAAMTADEGFELWVSDGTTAGTQLLKDINPGTGDGLPSILLNFHNATSLQDARTRLYGGKIFLTANNGTNGTELWITDGTAAGTTMVKDINPGPDSSIVDTAFSYFYAPFGLVFAANDGSVGNELWRSDSTEPGTVRIEDINPGGGSSDPAFMFVFNDRLLFSANDGDNVNGDRDLYRLDLSLSIPIHLFDFTASPHGKSVQLKWTTSEEINSSHFEIEKSNDGRQFRKIGSIAAVTNSSQKRSYQFVDADALTSGSKKLFYRLRMVDIDAKFSYSRIAIVNSIPDVGLFYTYPNPANNRLVLMMNSSIARQSKMRITDQQGKVVYSQQVSTVQGANQFIINIASLSKGVYYLQLLTDKGLRSVKFIKN